MITSLTLGYFAGRKPSATIFDTQPGATAPGGATTPPQDTAPAKPQTPAEPAAPSQSDAPAKGENLYLPCYE
jgi:hypothetical protein